MRRSTEPARPGVDEDPDGAQGIVDGELDQTAALAADLTRAADLLQALSSASRLRTLQAAGALLAEWGRCSVNDLVLATGHPPREVVDDLVRLQAGELVTLTGRDVAVDLQVLGAAAEALAAHHPVSRVLTDFPDLAGFFRHGRLVRLPEDADRRRRVAALAAELLPVDVVLTEGQVNRCLHQVHDDHAALRRLIADEGFLERGASRSYLRVVGAEDTSDEPR
ncbi:MAG TPA: DUF2087 domain-containing protein [Microlunatus sp.]|nr:DUF2087 domain-containing protein [Microlunatus sp.]